MIWDDPTFVYMDENPPVSKYNKQHAENRSYTKVRHNLI